MMRCPTLVDLPPPPAGKTGWPWTREAAPAASAARWEPVAAHQMALFPSYRGQTLLPEMISSMSDQGFALVHLERGFWDSSSGYLIEADGIFVRMDRLAGDFADRRGQATRPDIISDIDASKELGTAAPARQ